MDAQNNTSQGESTGNTFIKTTEHTKGHKMLLGILSYIGILVIISFLFKKDDAFVKFHVKQGLVLFAISVIIWILSNFLGGFGGMLWIVYRILNLGVLVLSIIGIVNVTQNKMTELPIVGYLSKHFPI